MVPSVTADSAAAVSPRGDPFDLNEGRAYERWRRWKLEHRPQSVSDLLVPVAEPAAVSTAEQESIRDRCRRANMAIYRLEGGEPANKAALRALASQFGLTRLDANLCADEDGITALRVNPMGRHRGYIPYSNRRLNWHTDGYYNPPEQQIRGVVMHCVRPAAQGGANVLLDHELVYLQMRDQDPDLVAALMEPDAMTIPANADGDAEVRAAQTGPVFSVDKSTGSLHMRYTARKRSIEWKRDARTMEAVALLEQLLAESPFRLKHRLGAGEGIICNNVLHCREAFEDGSSAARQRLLLRARYYDRVAGTGPDESDW